MTDNKCEKCGGEFVMKKNNQTGASFLACNNWPACKNSKPMPKEDKVEVVDMVEKAEKERVYDTYAMEPNDKYEEDNYQIKSRDVRARALASAIEWRTNASDRDQLLETAKRFEKYIRFGV